MPTIAEIIADINLRLPHSTGTYTNAVKVGWMNDLQREVWRWVASTNTTSITASTTAASYTLASNITPDQIKRVQVFDSGTSTGGFTDYAFADETNRESGNWYMESGQFILYPAATTSLLVKITHVDKPIDIALSTATTTNYVDSALDAEYHDLYKWRVMKLIAQSGNAPDVELANNYQANEDEMMKRIKMRYYKNQQKMPKSKPWSYKQGWYQG